MSSKSDKVFEIQDPASGQGIGRCPESTTVDLEDAIQAASQAFFFGWFAEEAPQIYSDVVSHSMSGGRAQILKQLIGVCGLITPWNFPLAMGARKIAAALAAGCTVVLESDGLTPFISNILAVLGESVGLPKGDFNVVTALNNTQALCLALCQLDTVKKISFTGSTRVDKLLMQQSASTLKVLSLELGGNAPFIVFDDADVGVVVASALASKFKVLVNKFLRFFTKPNTPMLFCCPNILVKM